jgi:hypothetical protein
VSRCRLAERIRKNPDYVGITRFLDAHDLPHRVAYPGTRTSGHPALFITLPDGREVNYCIASTPKQSLNVAKCVAGVRRFLASQGFSRP